MGWCGDVQIDWFWSERGKDVKLRVEVLTIMKV